MSMLTPIQSLEDVLNRAKAHELMVVKLMRVRQISESVDGTIDRLLSERDYLVALLDRFFEGRPNPFKEFPNDAYIWKMRGAIEHVFSAKCVRCGGIGEIIVPGSNGLDSVACALCNSPGRR